MSWARRPASVAAPLGLLAVLVFLRPDAALASTLAEFYQNAIEARESGDLEGYHRWMQDAHELEPQQPAVQLHLARSLAALDRTEEAIVWLDVLLNRGYPLDIADDPWLASVRAHPDSLRLALRSAVVGLPTDRSREGFSLPQRDLLPEGIAYDSRDGSFYVGSMAHRKIVRRRVDGTIEDFVASRQDGLYSVLGMKVDTSRRLLWTCAAADDALGLANDAEIGRSGLWRWNLAAGALQGRYEAPDDGSPHFFNDLELAPDGTVYLTDSADGAVYVLRAGSGQLESLVPPGTFKGPNGIALAKDGRHLFVAEYAYGIAVLDLHSLDHWRLDHDDAIAAAGVDGLYVHGETLLAVQNYLGLNRAVRFTLADDRTRILGVEVLDAHHPRLDDPTTGVVVEDRFYFIANSHIASAQSRGVLPAWDDLDDVLILEVALSGSAEEHGPRPVVLLPIVLGLRHEHLQAMPALRQWSRDTLSFPDVLADAPGALGLLSLLSGSTARALAALLLHDEEFDAGPALRLRILELDPALRSDPELRRAWWDLETPSESFLFGGPPARERDPPPVVLLHAVAMPDDPEQLDAELGKLFQAAKRSIAPASRHVLLCGLPDAPQNAGAARRILDGPYWRVPAFWRAPGTTGARDARPLQLSDLLRDNFPAQVGLEPTGAVSPPASRAEQRISSWWSAAGGVLYAQGAAGALLYDGRLWRQLQREPDGSLIEIRAEQRASLVSGATELLTELFSAPLDLVVWVRGGPQLEMLDLEIRSDLPLGEVEAWGFEDFDEFRSSDPKRLRLELLADAEGDAIRVPLANELPGLQLYALPVITRLALGVPIGAGSHGVNVGLRQLEMRPLDRQFWTSIVREPPLDPAQWLRERSEGVYVWLVPRKTRTW